MKYSTKENPVNNDYTPFPEGEYELSVVKAEVKPTKNGRGEMLSLQLQVVAGQHKGRGFFENLCVNHDSEMTQQIARGKLSEICLAMGIEEFEDESELVGPVFKAIVKIEPGKDGYDDSNKIKRCVIAKEKRKTKVDKSSFVAKHGGGEEYVPQTNGVETAEEEDDLPESFSEKPKLW